MMTILDLIRALDDAFDALGDDAEVVIWRGNVIPNQGIKSVECRPALLDDEGSKCLDAEVLIILE